MVVEHTRKSKSKVNWTGIASKMSSVDEDVNGTEEFGHALFTAYKDLIQPMKELLEMYVNRTVEDYNTTVEPEKGKMSMKASSSRKPGKTMARKSWNVKAANRKRKVVTSGEPSLCPDCQLEVKQAADAKITFQIQEDEDFNGTTMPMEANVLCTICERIYHNHCLKPNMFITRSGVSRFYCNNCVVSKLRACDTTFGFRDCEDDFSLDEFGGKNEEYFKY
jgi:hypothetical protein